MVVYIGTPIVIFRLLITTKNKCLTKITKERKQCYLSGDFNIDLLKYDKHRHFLNMVTSFGYLPYIIHPTRTTDNTSTLIDNIYSNNLQDEIIGGNIYSNNLQDEIIGGNIYSNNLQDEIIGGNILIPFADHLAQFLSINNRKYQSNISAENWINYFKSIFNSDNGNPLPKHFEQGGPLDCEITLEETMDAHKYLQQGKAPGLDNITNEMLICSAEFYPL